MNTSVRIKVLCFSIIVLLSQIFIPVVTIQGQGITPDIIIIFLVYMGYYYGRTEAIIIGFLLGFIQDLATQYELIGIMSFVKSLAGYALGTLALYRSIWHRNFRILFIFFIFSLHFYIYHFIKLNGTTISSLLFLKLILIHTIASFLVLLIFDKSIMKDGVAS